MVKPTTPPEVVAFFRTMQARRQRTTKPCAVCGTEMRDVVTKRQYCSVRCHSTAARQRKPKPTPAREAP